MDLERIKQNFRIRSGRAKKLKKPTKAQQSIETKSATAPSITPSATTTDQLETTVNGEIELANASQVSTEPVLQEESKSTIPLPEDFQLNEPPPHRPDLPHAATEIPGEEVHQKKPVEHENHVVKATPPDLSRSMTELHATATSPSSEAEDFDLRPPAPRPKPPSVEALADQLFSSGHLNSLLHQPVQLSRFTAFLHRYRPDDHPYLAQYLETQKAIKAVEYANAVAECLHPEKIDDDRLPHTKKAASLDSEFEKLSQISFQALTGRALPMFVTYNLIKTCSECLTSEITGRSTPMMRDLVGGLSEIFCLSDPTQEDNPIIYASEEFYRLTGYGQDDVIGRNCRFLQGPRTKREAPQRLREAVENGEEICETLLNYRRDGRPFINLLMLAPLHDNKGKLKYYIGAQVDVTGLVEDGRGLEAFKKYLRRKYLDAKFDEQRKRRQGAGTDHERRGRVLVKLRDLSEMFDLEESAVVQTHSRSTSLVRDDDESIAGSDRQRYPRRRYGEESSDADEEDDDGDDSAADWKLGNSGDGRLSGKLPGIYETFMLIRPSPSSRIVFVSPKLRKIGNVLQHPFLAHIAAPGSTLSGLRESFTAGVPVSARIHFMPERGENRNGTKLKAGSKHEDGKHGKACWISCTPLLGADDRIGVWMVVFIEKSRAMNLQKRNRLGSLQNLGRSEIDEGYRDTPERTVNDKTRSTDQAEGPRQSKPHSKVPRSSEAPAKLKTNSQTHPQIRTDNLQANVPIKPIRLDSQTVLKTTNDEIHTEDTKAYKAPKRPHTPSPTAPRHVIAAESPIEEYQEEKKIKTSYNVGNATNVTQGNTGSNVNGPSSEGFVTTRSPTTPDDNGRLLIQDDSDSADDNRDRAPLSEYNLRHHHQQRGGSQSPSPVWSPAAESPIPSSPDIEASRNAHSQRRFSDDDVFAGGRKQNSPPPQQSGYKHESRPMSPPGIDSDGEEFGEDFDERTHEESQNWQEGEQLGENTFPEHKEGVDENELDDSLTPVNTRPNTSSGQKTHPARMDYLSHPGTSRLTSGRWPGSADRGNDDGSEFSIDVDCARSPYSVD